MKFRTPLKRRMAKAEQLQRRYRADPEYRLRKVNYSRARRGLPIAETIADIGCFGAPIRDRGHRGRFVPCG